MTMDWKEEIDNDLGISLLHEKHYTIVRKVFGIPVPKKGLIKWLQDMFDETVTWAYIPKETDYPNNTALCVVQEHKSSGDTLVYLKDKNDYLNFILNYKGNENNTYRYIEIPDIYAGMYNFERDQIILTPEEEIKYTYFKEELNKINI